MKFSFLIALFLPSIILVSCAAQQQNALIKENQEKSDTNINAAYLEEKETEGDVIVKHKILIAPFEYRQAKSKYPNPEIYKAIFFSSFYNLFSVLPTIDLPDKNELLTMNPSENTISSLANRYKCDFIVFGDYGLRGDKSKPEAVVNLKIWNKMTGSILTDRIKTPTDADLFENIDSLMSKMVRTILNEEMKIAYLNFVNFDTGKEKLGIFINHKLIAEPVSNDFKLDMKILSGKDYKVGVRRFFDGKLLADKVVNLNPGESINFSATNYRTNLIKNGEFKNVNDVVSLRWDWGKDDYSIYDAGHVNKWNLNSGNSARSSVLIENGECDIKIINPGPQWNSVSLVTAPVKLEAEKNYRISFDARASGPRNIYYGILRYNGGWIDYITVKAMMHKFFTVDNKLKNYSLKFKMIFPTDENSYLQISLSDSTNEVWIKNVCVEEMD